MRKPKTKAKPKVKAESKVKRGRKSALDKIFEANLKKHSKDNRINPRSYELGWNKKPSDTESGKK